MRWDVPLRELGSAVSIVGGGAESGVVDDGDAGTTEPEHRRGPAYVVVQMLAMAVLVGIVFAMKVLLVPYVDLGYAAAVGALGLALPLALHWFATPPGRGAGLAAGVAAGVVTAAVVWFALLPVAGAAWTTFLTLVLGFLAAGAVFGAVSPTTPSRTS